MRQVKKAKKPLIPLKAKLILGAFVVFVLGVFIFFLTPPGKFVIRTTQSGIHTLEQKAQLTLKRVVIEGHARTTKEEVVTVLNIAQGMSMMELDLEDIRMRVSALPWVKSVLVERHLPSSLRIGVEEKTPIALWQNRQKYLPLDQDGNTINDTTTVLSNLILVVGADAPQNTPALVALLEQYPQLVSRVRSAVRVGDRRWNLIFHDIENGTVVYLPESEIKGAIARLQSLQDKQQILEKDLKVIDLRLADRLIVRTTADLTDNEAKDKKK